MNPTERNGQPNLTAVQRALEAAKHVSEFARDAKERQKAGTLAPAKAKGKATAKAAALFDVSPRYVELAKRILEGGTHDLIRLVTLGRVPLHVAARIAEGSHDNQQRALLGWRKGPLKDPYGRPIPPELQRAFNKVEFCKGVCLRNIEGMRHALEELQEAQLIGEKSSDEAMSHLDEIETIIRCQTLHALCPYCKGQMQRPGSESNCICRGRGWLTEEKHDMLPLRETI